jgi:DNA processing protein
MVNPEEQLYANALNLIPQLGPVRLLHLHTHFKSFRKAWHASRTDYVNSGFNPKLVEQIINQKEILDPSLEFGKLAKFGIQIVLMESAEYPDILKQIPAAPPILYVRGQVEALNTAAIGVVGTRKMTAYGKAATIEIVTGLVNSHLTIVSGLAYGVDAEALKAAVDLGGRTVAVLGTPIDNAGISPKTNFNLAQKIMENGCLISEHGLGAPVGKQNFPTRNRIISGLSLGTVVVEADTDSGALITANYSLEQNREVFAVPGPIFSDVSKGTNALIKKGAKLVSSYTDILEELNLDQTPMPEIELDNTTSDQEQIVIENLTREPVHIDDLVRNLNLPASEINATLALLEMKGRVRSLGGAKFVKIR